MRFPGIGLFALQPFLRSCNRHLQERL